MPIHPSTKRCVEFLLFGLPFLLMCFSDSGTVQGWAGLFFLVNLTAYALYALRDLPINALTAWAEGDSGKRGYVYVIRDKSTGLYKIGRTKNLQRRMKQLGVGTTAQLIKSSLVSDSYATEKAAHKRYKAARLPQTEYFKLWHEPTI